MMMMMMKMMMMMNVIVCFATVFWMAILVSGSISFSASSKQSLEQNDTLTLDNDSATCLTFDAGDSSPAHVDLTVNIQGAGSTYEFKMYGSNLKCLGDEEAKLFVVPLTAAMVDQPLGRTTICQVTYSSDDDQQCTFSCERDADIVQLRIIRRPRDIHHELWTLCEVTGNLCPSPEWWHVPSLENCYTINQDPANYLKWSEAKSLCLGLDSGAHLLDLQTYEEQLILQNITRANYGALGVIFMSASRPAGSSVYDDFYWGGTVSVSAQAWTSWEPGQPNSMSDDCIGIISSHMPDWWWYDTYCSNVYNYICELHIGN